MRKLGEYQVVSDGRLILGPGQEVSQELVARSNGLAGVRLLMFNPKLGGEGKYKVSVLDNEGKELVSQTVAESNMSWEEWLRIDFGNLPETEGKELTLVIGREGVQKGEAVVSTLNRSRLNLTEGDVLRAYTTEEIEAADKGYAGIGFALGDEYKGGVMKLNGEAVKADLTFQIFYSQPLAEYVASSIQTAGVRLVQDSSFFGEYVLMLVVVLVVIGWRARRLLGSGLRKSKL